MALSVSLRGFEGASVDEWLQVMEGVGVVPELRGAVGENRACVVKKLDLP